MNATEAESFIGKTINGRQVAAVHVSGGCTDRRLYLLDAHGDRVVNVTNLTTEELQHQMNRKPAAQGARHKTG